MSRTSPSPPTSAAFAAASPILLAQLPSRAAPAAPAKTSSPPPTSFHQIPLPPIAYPINPARAFHPVPVRHLSAEQLVNVATSLGRSPTLLPLPPHSNSRPYAFVPDYAVRQVAGHALPRPTAAATAAVPSALPPPPPLRFHPAQPLPKLDQYPGLASMVDYKIRDKNGSEDHLVVYGRKVKLNDGGPTSMYALCRSWIRNGLHQENQVQDAEGRLPKRACRVGTAHASEVIEVLDDDIEAADKEESVGSIDEMSLEDLLKEHVKRAKKVRARIKEQRFRRIHPYRQRLFSIIERIQEAEADPGNGNSIAVGP